MTSQWRHILLCAALLGVPTGLVFWGQGRGMDSGEAFSSVLNFTGGLGGSLVSFVLPAAIYLRQRRALQPEQQGSIATLCAAWAMFFVGLAIAIYVPITTMQAAL